MIPNSIVNVSSYTGKTNLEIENAQWSELVKTSKKKNSLGLDEKYEGIILNYLRSELQNNKLKNSPNRNSDKYQIESFFSIKSFEKSANNYLIRVILEELRKTFFDHSNDGNKFYGLKFYNNVF